jgi:hypothetical protein
MLNAHALQVGDWGLFLTQTSARRTTVKKKMVIINLFLSGIIGSALGSALGLPFLPGVHDTGIVLPFGSAPGRADYLGARDTWAWYDSSDIETPFHLTYDGSGPEGWLACLAVTSDLTLRNWTLLGPVLKLGQPGSVDSKSASYLTTYRAQQHEGWVRWRSL